MGKVIDENPMPHARGLGGLGHLERHELAVVADNGVGGLVAGIVVEVGEPLHEPTAAIEGELIEVYVPRTLAVVMVALDEGEAAVGGDSLGLVLLLWRCR